MASAHSLHTAAKAITMLDIPTLLMNTNRLRCIRLSVDVAATSREGLWKIAEEGAAAKETAEEAIR
jgi:hypothetical protein